MLQIQDTRKIKAILDIFLIVLAITATFIVITLTGFYVNDYWFELLSKAAEYIIILFAVQEFARLFFVKKMKPYLKTRWFELLLAFSFVLNEVFNRPLIWFVQNLFGNIKPHTVILVYLLFTMLSLLIAVIIKIVRRNYLLSRIKMHPGALFAISFGIMIFIGSLLLMMPKATVPKSDFTYLDSLFTSTSAVCVTGLVVVDTATQFTLLGKIIILILIQIGGLGVMTITTFFALFFGSGLSYRFRIVIGDLMSEESIGEVSSLLKRIALFTFIIELIVTINLYLSLGGILLPVDKNLLFNSAFHSVSAFCNAGFSLYSSNLMDKIILHNFWFNFNILILIILGGIGFPVLVNLMRAFRKENRRRRWNDRLNINTKIVLKTTLILLISGTIIVFLTDFTSPNLGSNSIEKIYNSLFISITSRTAGFNTIAMESITPAAALIVIVLMWIGASPNSTGGGIKTSTFAVAVMYLFTYIRGRNKLNIHWREIDMLTIRKAFMVILASFIVLFASTFLLTWIEPDKSLLDLLFEATSAISTVGLSRNVTFSLGNGGKWVIIALMFMGRIGILTFFLSFFRPKLEPKYKFPKENIVM
jgi:potassium uptake TrkH family protein